MEIRTCKNLSCEYYGREVVPMRERDFLYCPACYSEEHREQSEKVIKTAMIEGKEINIREYPELISRVFQKKATAVLMDTHISRDFVVQTGVGVGMGHHSSWGMIREFFFPDDPKTDWPGWDEKLRSLSTDKKMRFDHFWLSEMDISRLVEGNENR